MSCIPSDILQYQVRRETPAYIEQCRREIRRFQRKTPHLKQWLLIDQRSECKLSIRILLTEVPCRIARRLVIFVHRPLNVCFESVCALSGNDAAFQWVRGSRRCCFREGSRSKPAGVNRWRRSLTMMSRPTRRARKLLYLITSVLQVEIQVMSGSSQYSTRDYRYLLAHRVSLARRRAVLQALYTKSLVRKRKHWQGHWVHIQMVTKTNLGM